MNLRILSAALLAVAAAALCLAATASATTLTYSPELLAPPETPFTGAIVAESEGHVVLHNPIAKVECASRIEGEVENHGAGEAASGAVDSLTFTGCTNSWHVTAAAAGTLSVEEIESGLGQVRSTGATVEATRFGVTCRYATNNTYVGTLTDSYTTVDYATLHIEAAIPFHSGSFLCGGGAVTWTGSYEVTTPELLVVEQMNEEPVVVPKHKNAKGEIGVFIKGVEEEVTMLHIASPVDYTLKEVLVSAKSGGWEPIDSEKCEEKKVEKGKKAGTEICKMKIKCLNNGRAFISTTTVWETGEGGLLFPIKC